MVQIYMRIYVELPQSLCNIGFSDKRISSFEGAPVAQWVKRWSTDLAVPGLNPA